MFKDERMDPKLQNRGGSNGGDAAYYPIQPTLLWPLVQCVVVCSNKLIIWMILCPNKSVIRYFILSLFTSWALARVHRWMKLPPLSLWRENHTIWWEINDRIIQSNLWLSMETIRIFHENETEIFFNNTKVINDNFTWSLMNIVLTVNSVIIILIVNLLVLVWLKMKVSKYFIDRGFF